MIVHHLPFRVLGGSRKGAWVGGLPELSNCYCHPGRAGGLPVWAKARQIVNRNFWREEWRQFFPDTTYRRTIRYLPWPTDLIGDERKQAEAFEKEHAEANGR